MSEPLQYACDEHGWCDFTPCPKCKPPTPQSTDADLLEQLDQWQKITGDWGKAIELIQQAAARIRVLMQEREDARKEAHKIFYLLQVCLQPAGSPLPSGDIEANTRWIIQSVLDERDTLRTKLSQTEKVGEELENKFTELKDDIRDEYPNTAKIGDEEITAWQNREK